MEHCTSLRRLSYNDGNYLLDNLLFLLLQLSWLYPESSITVALLATSAPRMSIAGNSFNVTAGGEAEVFVQHRNGSKHNLFIVDVVCWWWPLPPHPNDTTLHQTTLHQTTEHYRTLHYTRMHNLNINLIHRSTTEHNNILHHTRPHFVMVRHEVWGV